jgi:hypothetical protein
MRPDPNPGDYAAAQMGEEAVISAVTAPARCMFF